MNVSAMNVGVYILLISIATGHAAAFSLSKRQASRCGDPTNPTTPIGRCTLAGNTGDVVTVCNGCVPVFRRFFSCAGVNQDALLNQLQRSCDNLNAVSTTSTPATTASRPTSTTPGTTTSRPTTSTPAGTASESTTTTTTAPTSTSNGICSDAGDPNTDLNVCLVEFLAENDIACESFCRSLMQDYASQCLGEEEAQIYNDEITAQCGSTNGGITPTLSSDSDRDEMSGGTATTVSSISFTIVLLGAFAAVFN